MKEHFVEHEKRVEIQKSIDKATDLMVRCFGASAFFAIVAGFTVNSNEKLFTLSLIGAAIGFLAGMFKGVQAVNAEELLKKMRG